MYEHGILESVMHVGYEHMDIHYTNATTTLPIKIKERKGRRMKGKTESSNINMPSLIRPT